MNVSYSTLIQAFKTVISAHTFPANTPTVLLGARRATSASGAVCIVDIGDQQPETGVVDQVYGEHNITVLITCGIPWSDDDSNVLAAWDLAQEIEKIIGSNRYVAGVVSVYIQSVHPLLFSFLSGSGQQYRGVEYRLNCLDYRNPTGVN
jgi:hypothetical protein